MIREGDATPRSGFIRSIINNAGYALTHILGELIDNSLDAEATEIEICCDDDELLISDNGHGCPDMESMATLGSGAGKTDSMGRYGIGLKESAIWLASRMVISSRADNQVYGADVNWDRMDATGNWKFPISETRQDRGPSFMKIWFQGVRAGRLRGFNKTLRDRLCYLYTPALIHHKRIVSNDESLRPVPFPALTDELAAQGEFRNHAWKMRAGILDSTPTTWKPGYNLALHDRMIASARNEGMGEFVTNRFFAYVELLESPDHRWPVDRMKHGLVDQVDFLESLYPYCAELLEKAQAKSQDLRLDRLARELSEQVTLTIGEFSRIREKRNRGESKGTQEPKETGRERTHAEKTDASKPGSVESDGQRHKKVSRVTMTFADLPGERIGEPASAGRGKIIVRLNKNHPLFSGAIEPKLAAVEVFNLLSAYLKIHEANGQILLDYEEANSGGWVERFSDLTGSLIASWLRTQEGA